MPSLESCSADPGGASSSTITVERVYLGPGGDTAAAAALKTQDYQPPQGSSGWGGDRRMSCSWGGGGGVDSSCYIVEGEAVREPRHTDVGCSLSSGETQECVCGGGGRREGLRGRGRAQKGYLWSKVYHSLKSQALSCLVLLWPSA